MPTYEYKCDACGHSFEKFQSITAAPIKKCPSCGKTKVRRLIGTGSGMIFKGSGFYTTDYRSESYQKAAKADKGESTGGDAKPDTKSDAKPETKAESKSETKPDTKPDATPQPKSESQSADSANQSKTERKPPPKNDPPASRSARKR